MELVDSSSFLTLWSIFMLITIVISIISLINILNNQFPNNDKLIWVLVVLFLPILGSILYFIIGRPKRL